METLNGEGAVLASGGGEVLAGRGSIDADGGAGNRGFIGIGDDADEAAALGRGCGDLLRGGEQGRNAEKNEARELLETHQRSYREPVRQCMLSDPPAGESSVSMRTPA